MINKIKILENLTLILLLGLNEYIDEEMIAIKKLNQRKKDMDNQIKMHYLYIDRYRSRLNELED